MYPVTGQSLLPALNGSSAAPHTTPFGDESYGRAYVYSSDGTWKARWTEPAQGGPADGPLGAVQHSARPRRDQRRFGSK